MDELEISGKRYISTRLAGKEHKYHADYVGQLIRGGKVAGQKVGRSWYVDAESLAVYLGQETTPRGPQLKKPAAKKAAAEPIEEKTGIEEALEPEAEAGEIEAPEPEDTKDDEKQVEEEEALAEIEEKIEAEKKPLEKEVEDSHKLRMKSLMPRPLQAHAHKVEKKAPKHEEKEVEIKKDTREEKTTEQVPIKIVSTPRLRYIEERPAFPHIETRAHIATMPQALEKNEPQELEVAPRLPKRKARRLMPAITVLVAGALILALMTALSAFLVSTTTVKGEAASTGYALSAYSTSF